MYLIHNLIHTLSPLHLSSEDIDTSMKEVTEEQHDLHILSELPTLQSSVADLTTERDNAETKSSEEQSEDEAEEKMTVSNANANGGNNESTASVPSKETTETATPTKQLPPTDIAATTPPPPSSNKAWEQPPPPPNSVHSTNSSMLLMRGDGGSNSSSSSSSISSRVSISEGMRSDEEGDTEGDLTRNVGGIDLSDREYSYVGREEEEQWGEFTPDDDLLSDDGGEDYEYPIDPDEEVVDDAVDDAVNEIMKRNDLIDTQIANETHVENTEDATYTNPAASVDSFEIGFARSGFDIINIPGSRTSTLLSMVFKYSCKAGITMHELTSTHCITFRGSHPINVRCCETLEDLGINNGDVIVVKGDIDGKKVDGPMHVGDHTNKSPRNDDEIVIRIGVVYTNRLKQRILEHQQYTVSSTTTPVGLVLQHYSSKLGIQGATFSFQRYKELNSSTQYTCNDLGMVADDIIMINTEEEVSVTTPPQHNVQAATESQSPTGMIISYCVHLVVLFECI